MGRLAAVYLIGLTAMLMLNVVPVSGQATRLAREVFVNSDAELYLRVLQGRDRSRLYPWTVRSFSMGEVDGLLRDTSAHPWEGRFPNSADQTRHAKFGWLRPGAELVFNSAFPSGANDGPVWAGRGLTSIVEAGFWARLGVVSLVVAPTFFRAENTDFPLLENGYTDRRKFANGLDPRRIDLPQRFGEGAYTRVGPGQTTLRADALGVGVGISTANQHWGPAREYPLLLGNNAPGFPHLFVGTSHPADVGIGRLHGRIVWGRLGQSEYAATQSDPAARLVSGVVASFTPRGVDGLELGAARLFHTELRNSQLSQSHLLKPLEGLFAVNTTNTAENQLASVFLRWVLPKSGFEIFGEVARDDYAYDLRDLAIGPDRNSGYTLGFQKTWEPGRGDIFVLRGEVVNARTSPRAPLGFHIPFYVHGDVTQGHTHEGQALGSPAAFGGSGATLAADYYHDGGRWTYTWTRELRGDRGQFGSSGSRGGLDVVHTFGVNAIFFQDRFDITTGVEGAYDFNRNFSEDVFNLNLAFGVRATL